VNFHTTLKHGEPANTTLKHGEPANSMLKHGEPEHTKGSASFMALKGADLTIG
jgi:hypothetical protein